MRINSRTYTVIRGIRVVTDKNKLTERDVDNDIPDGTLEFETCSKLSNIIVN